MLSVQALGNLGNKGSSAKLAANYYCERSADYYIKDLKQKQEGAWIGEGTEILSLSGAIAREDFQMALAGHMAGKSVKNANDPKRQMGWDLTYSVPKSVSVAWAMADLSLREKIEQAHKIATDKAFQYLEPKIITRRGAGGKKQEQAFIAATHFVHHTSREGDPQLHSHVVIPNICVRSDGTVGTIGSYAFYEYKLTAGALYQAELAWQMRQLGFAIESGEKGTFRLKNMDTKVEDLFSKRAQQIDKKTDELEIQSYAGARKVVLSTRKAKEETSLSEREEFWKDELAEINLSAEIIKSDEPAKINETPLDEIVISSREKITDSQSVFREKDIVKELARSSYSQLDINGILNLFHSSEQKNEIINMGKDKHQKTVYTTQEMITIEQTMITTVEELAQRTNYVVPSTSFINKRPYLSNEQKTSIQTATSDSAIAVIQGRAGAGKTTILKVVNESYQEAGWNVQGITISGQAAHVLQSKTDIPSKTIASWRNDPQINNSTVLIVDEAGMIGSKTMEEILRIAQQGNAKVILVGDERQLQPINAGGALHAVDKKLIKTAPQYSSQIETIRRQKEEWMRQVVLEAARGNTTEAMELLDEHNKIHIYNTAPHARLSLIEDYLKNYSDNQTKALILTHRRAEANQINAQIRESLKEKDMLGTNTLNIHNDHRKISFSSGDRIIFTKNDYNFNVRNGQRGCITGIDKKLNSIKVKLDDGEQKAIPLDQYNHIEYGWATTTHKAQGITTDRVYIFGHSMEPMASQQSTYVQISRSREETKLYIVGGEKSIERSEHDDHTQNINMEEKKEVLQQMIKLWGQDKAKDTTIDYTKSKQKENTVNPQEGLLSAYV